MVRRSIRHCRQFSDAANSATRRKFEPNAARFTNTPSSCRAENVPVCQRREAMMNHLVAAAICLAILYTVDAAFFGGWYFATANQAIERAWALNWW
jgi:hypothetical protein